MYIITMWCDHRTDTIIFIICKMEYNNHITYYCIHFSLLMTMSRNSWMIALQKCPSSCWLCSLTCLSNSSNLISTSPSKSSNALVELTILIFWNWKMCFNDLFSFKKQSWHIYINLKGGCTRFIYVQLQISCTLPLE